MTVTIKNIESLYLMALPSAAVEAESPLTVPNRPFHRIVAFHDKAASVDFGRNLALMDQDEPPHAK